MWCITYKGRPVRIETLEILTGLTAHRTTSLSGFIFDQWERDAIRHFVEAFQLPWSKRPKNVSVIRFEKAKAKPKKWKVPNYGAESTTTQPEGLPENHSHKGNGNRKAKNIGRKRSAYKTRQYAYNQNQKGDF